jgi:hypothetical protein
MAVGLLVGGCAGTHQEPATPMIFVEPRGLAERLAIMDRYRLHDEERKRMMARPRVWVEEIPEEEIPAEEAPDDEPPSEAQSR